MAYGSFFRSSGIDRREFMASLAAAVAALSWSPAWAQSAPSAADIEKTHEALFQLWFPQSELGLPPAADKQIGEIAAAVSKAMLTAFEDSPVAQLLAGFTMPEALPFYAELKASSDSAVQAFISTAGGFGAMDPALRTPLYSFLIEGTAGPVSTQVAAILREAYLSSIWDLPLAQPLASFLAPPVFVSRPDIYAELNAPKIAPSRLTYDAAQKTISHRDGSIEYLVIGSGPGGATVASQLQAAGKRVVLIEKGLDDDAQLSAAHVQG
jgi:hypothetical protein